VIYFFSLEREGGESKTLTTNRRKEKRMPLKKVLKPLGRKKIYHEC